MQIKAFLLSEKFLSKVPVILLVIIFMTPLVLLNVSYQLGIFFIAFYISYWTVKVFESYYYVLTSYIALLRTNRRDYSETSVIRNEAKELQHIVIVPIYAEPFDVIDDNIRSIVENEYPYKQNITVLLATEARGPNAIADAEAIIEKYKNAEIRVVNIVHPDGLPNE